jgi:hypothetical protein
MMLLKKKEQVEIKISKHIDDLRSIDAVLTEPRSWSPDELKEACNNIAFHSNGEVEELEFLTLTFLFKNFFYLLHQTGLYNPQKKLWSHIAQTKTVYIKPFTKIPKKHLEDTKISDITLEDHQKRFLKVRLVSPGSEISYCGFSDLISSVPGKCMGLIYISEQEPTAKVSNDISKRIKAEDQYNRYKSPLTENCSLNLIRYELEKTDGANLYNYRLVHPDLGREVEAKLCWEHS